MFDFGPSGKVISRAVLENLLFHLCTENVDVFNLEDDFEM
jgi:hypothetical protein